MAEGTYRHKAAEPFGDFVTDIARVEVGENENVGMPRNLGAGSLEFTDRRNDCRVELEFAVRVDIGRDFLEFVESRNYLIDVGCFALPLVE